MDALLGPLSARHPMTMASFGRHAIRSAAGLATHKFPERAHARDVRWSRGAQHGAARQARDRRLRARIDRRGAHRRMAGGARRFTELCDAHGRVSPVARRRARDECAASIRSPTFRASRVVLCDVTPRQFIRMAGDRLPRLYRWRLSRYRYGPGVFKMDWALNAPVPWRARECDRAGTVHLGGTLSEIAESERAAWNGRDAERPYVLVVQASRFDPTRAPERKTHAVGVLSRAARVDSRHARPCRASDRAIRSGLSRLHRRSRT